MGEQQLTAPVQRRAQKRRKGIFSRLFQFVTSLHPANWFNEFREIEISLDEL